MYRVSQKKKNETRINAELVRISEMLSWTLQKHMQKLQRLTKVKNY